MTLRNLVLLGTLAVAPVFAQTQSINGSIRGRVTDATGAPIPGAQVNAKNESTGFARSLDTTDDGYYVFPNLPLGTYAVTMQKQGFETQRHTGVTLDAGTEAVIDSQLKVGSVSTEVEVTGGAPIVEPSRGGRWPHHRLCGSEQPSAHVAATRTTSLFSSPASAAIPIPSWASRAR